MERGVAVRTADDKRALLAEVLQQAGFWTFLEETRRGDSADRDSFPILIKPDMDLFDVGSPTGTDFELVEHLIDLLHDRQWENVAICCARIDLSDALENRDVLTVADLGG